VLGSSIALMNMIVSVTERTRRGTKALELSVLPLLNAMIIGQLGGLVGIILDRVRYRNCLRLCICYSVGRYLPHSLLVLS
jgi:hypothetical protein